MEEQDFYKEELLKHVNGRMAYLPIPDFLEQVDFDKVGIRPNGLPYSFYELFYHVFYAQRDILEFIRQEDYKEPRWPDDYWPERSQPGSLEEWEDLKQSYAKDHKKLKANLKDADLKRPVKNATNPDQTLFRELLLILGHTAYHTGQMLVLLRLLKIYRS